MSFDYEFKMILLGDSSVGKSSICNQYAKGTFPSGYQATVGVDFGQQALSLEGKNIKLFIWDTAGQEKYSSMAKTYYKGCIGAIIVYDITSRSSFSNIPKWLDSLKAEANKNLIIKLVGNKLDIEVKREVTTEEAQLFAKENGMDFIECSAKENVNLQEVFSGLTQQILSKINSKEIFPIDENYGIKIGGPANLGQQTNQNAQGTGKCPC